MLLEYASGGLKAPHHVCCGLLLLVQDHSGGYLWGVRAARLITLDATKGDLLLRIPLEEGETLLGGAPMLEETGLFIWCEMVM